MANILIGLGGMLAGFGVAYFLKGGSSQSESKDQAKFKRVRVLGSGSFSQVKLPINGIFSIFLCSHLQWPSSS